MLVFLGADGILVWYNLSSDQVIDRYRLEPDGASALDDFSGFSVSASSTIVCCRGSKTVSVCRTATQRGPSRFQMEVRESIATVVSSSQDLTLSLDEEGQVELRSMVEQRRENLWTTSGGSLQFCQLCSKDELLLTVQQSRRLVIFQASTGEVFLEREFPEGLVSVQFADGGRYLAFLSFTGSIKVFELEWSLDNRRPDESEGLTFSKETSTRRLGRKIKNFFLRFHASLGLNP